MPSPTDEVKPDEMDLNSLSFVLNGSCSSNQSLIFLESLPSLLDRDLPNSECSSLVWFTRPLRLHIASCKFAHLCIVFIQVNLTLSDMPLPCVNPPLLFKDFIIVCSITRSVQRPAQ